MTTGFKRLEHAPYNVRVAPYGTTDLLNEAWEHMGNAHEVCFRSFRTGGGFSDHRWVHLGLFDPPLVDPVDCLVSLVSLEEHWLLAIGGGWCMSETFFLDDTLHPYSLYIMKGERTYPPTDQ